MHLWAEVTGIIPSFLPLALSQAPSQALGLQGTSQSHLWGSPHTSWGAGGQWRHCNSNKHCAGSDWKGSVGSAGFQPTWEGRSMPWCKGTVEGGRQPQEEELGLWGAGGWGEARVEAVGRKLLAAPARKLGGRDWGELVDRFWR